MISFLFVLRLGLELLDLVEDLDLDLFELHRVPGRQLGLRLGLSLGLDPELGDGLGLELSLGLGHELGFSVGLTDGRRLVFGFLGFLRHVEVLPFGKDLAAPR